MAKVVNRKISLGLSIILLLMAVIQSNAVEQYACTSNYDVYSIEQGKVVEYTVEQNNEKFFKVFVISGKSNLESYEKGETFYHSKYDCGLGKTQYCTGTFTSVNSTYYIVVESAEITGLTDVCYHISAEEEEYKTPSDSDDSSIGILGLVLLCLCVLPVLLVVSCIFNIIFLLTTTISCLRFRKYKNHVAVPRSDIEMEQRDELISKHTP